MKHAKFAIVVLTVCASLSGGMAQCPKKDRGAGPADAKSVASAAAALTQRVYDERSHVTIMVPDQWTVTRQNSNPVLFLIAPNAGPSGPMVNLVVENITQRMTPYDYLQANVITMRVSLSGLEVKEGGVELASPDSPAWIRYSYPRGGTRVEALTYCHTKDYMAYVLTALAPADQFPQYEPLFHAIGRSIQID